MQAYVTKWGNSLGVRIPRVLAHEIGIHEGTPVDLSIKDHHIVITKGLTLQALVDQITLENRHTEIHSGGACGEEAW